MILPDSAPPERWSGFVLRGPCSLRRVAVAVTVVALLLASAPPAQAITRGDEERSHVVVSGQTLRGIAKRFHLTVEALRDANDLPLGGRLKVGTRLVIPAAGTDDGRKRDARAREEEDADKPRPRPRKEREDKADRDGKASARGPKRKKDGDGDDDAAADAPARKAGYLRLVHEQEEWEGVAVDKRGHPTKAARAAFARLLRPEATRKARPIDARLIKAVVEVSDHFGGKPIQVVSPPRGEAKGPHASHAKHDKGAAIDFHVPGVSNAALRDYCKGLGDVGVGFNPHAAFLHLDVREASAFWIE